MGMSVCGGGSHTMSTPKDHQSALCVCPLLLTTSGAIYSTVPQKEYAFLSASTDSLLRPKSAGQQKKKGGKVKPTAGSVPSSNADKTILIHSNTDKGEAESQRSN